MASCLRGALPPVDLRVVCLVWAMVDDAVVDNEDGACDGARQIAPDRAKQGGTIWSLC